MKMKARYKQILIMALAIISAFLVYDEPLEYIFAVAMFFIGAMYARIGKGDEDE